LNILDAVVGVIFRGSKLLPSAAQVFNVMMNACKRLCSYWSGGVADEWHVCDPAASIPMHPTGGEKVMHACTHASQF
jgi:hypothetical protein